MNRLIGARVVAWRGEMQDKHGEVLRVNDVTHVLILWDDGIEGWYEASAIMREEFYGEPS